MRNTVTDPQILVDEGVISQKTLDGLSPASRAFFKVPRAYLDMALADWIASGAVPLDSEEDKAHPARTILRYITPREWSYEPGMIPDPQQQLSFSPEELKGYAVHKYTDSGQLLLYASPDCSGYCAAICYRKEFLDDSNPAKFSALGHHEEIAHYIRDYNTRHPDKPVRDVILSGGDPLLMNTKRLREMIEPICKALHESGIESPNIRIGTKELAFHPERVTTDDTLIPMMQEMQERYGANFNFMLHFTHPSELTLAKKDEQGKTEVEKALMTLRRSGCVEMYNQTPVVKGVNDDPKILRELCKKLQPLGVRPAYFFHPRDTGDKEWQEYAPSVEGLHKILKEVKAGLGSIEQFQEAASTEYGKMEVVAVEYDAKLNREFDRPLSDRVITLRVLRSPDSAKTGAVIRAFCDGSESWLTDFFTPEKLIDDHSRVVGHIAPLRSASQDPVLKGAVPSGVGFRP